MFQSTPAHDGRLPSVAEHCDTGRDVFQSTPAHDGRRRSSDAIDMANKFQSTPAHDGRRIAADGNGQRRTVSIHARTRRATGTTRRWAKYRVSIHARTRRATARTSRRTPRSRVSIHARTRRATATFSGGPGRPMPAVSIHARTRRATRELARPRRRCNEGEFQSTPAHDGRRGNQKEDALIAFQSTPAHDGRHCAWPIDQRQGFQSTPAHDGRRSTDRKTSVSRSFNPRPHTTGDAAV